MAEAEGVETIVPWSIRGIGTRTRDAVITAARREGVSVGTMLERIVDHWLADGAPAPVAASAAPAAPAPSAAELAALMQGVAALATAAKANAAITDADVRAAAATLRRETKTRRGPSPRPSRPRQLAAPGPDAGTADGA